MQNRIPQTSKAYLETNRSNILGNLWSTKGIDLQSNLGAVRLAQKLVTNTTTADDANLGRPGAFAHFDLRSWAICGTHIFKNSIGNNITNGFVADASSGVPTAFNSDVSDLAVFDARLWATDNGNLWSKAADGAGTGAWTQRSGWPSATTEKLLYFKKTNLLYMIGSATEIGSINAANVVSNSAGNPNYIDVGNSVEALTTMVGNNTSIWIGTMTENSKNLASILEWDGISAQITAEYPIQAGGILAMTVLNNIPYAVDSEGRLLKYSGYSFDEVCRLPVSRTLLTRATAVGTASVATAGRFIHPNGLVATKNNSILALVNNLNDDSTGTIAENIASGIWEADLGSKNFTHRYSFTLSSLSSATVTDFGQNRIAGAGALALNTTGSSGAAGRSTVIAGAKYYTNASSTSSGIYIDSPVNTTTDNEGQKRGYLVSAFIESEDAESSFGRIWATFRKFQNTTDNVTFKYRNTEQDSVEASITWVNTTSFTTTTDITAYGPSATGFNGLVGGEVEILQGTGSGATPHIASITSNAGTYTVVLNNAVTGVTNSTAKARFQKWILIGDAYALIAQIKSWAQLPIDSSNEARIQLKCCLQWTGTGEHYRIALWSNTNQKITN